jgi:hypothetical protein
VRITVTALLSYTGLQPAEEAKEAKNIAGTLMSVVEGPKVTIEWLAILRRVLERKES